ncbi:uncharacterized protein LOC110038274 [Phalaenopsis equestris]|uniref:uncharacterized protein LOC110038274 n=1 Tax=Phalaenopsis equestris TaxID=78828 RepID=UPI0009E2FC09|nr:uncharacterized protein LOC110038274 [Phalaenopsis equestris]
MALSLHPNPSILLHSSLTLSMDVLASPVSALFLPSNHRETPHLLKPPPPSSSFPNLSSPKPNSPFSLSASSKPLSLFPFFSTPSPPSTTLTGRTHHRASTGYAAALFDISKRGGAVALAAIARDVHRLASSIVSIIADSSIADEERAEAVRATVDRGGFDRRLVALVRMVVAKKRGVREVADVLEEFERLWRETTLAAGGGGGGGFGGGIGEEDGNRAAGEACWRGAEGLWSGSGED